MVFLCGQDDISLCALVCTSDHVCLFSSVKVSTVLFLCESESRKLDERATSHASGDDESAFVHAAP